MLLFQVWFPHTLPGADAVSILTMMKVPVFPDIVDNFPVFYPPVFTFLRILDKFDFVKSQLLHSL